MKTEKNIRVYVDTEETLRKRKTEKKGQKEIERER